MMSWRSLFASLAALTAAAALLPSPCLADEAKKPKKISVAILDLRAIGADELMARNLTELVASEVGRYKDVSAITRREVSNLLDFDRQRQLLGCDDDSCLTELVGALGVDKILSGQIGQVETSYVLTLHLIDVRTTRVDRHVSRVIPVDSNQLVSSVKAAVVELIGERVSRDNAPPRIAVEPSIVATREERVLLDASRCYDPDGDPLTVSWRQVSGPAAALDASGGAEASFVAREEGEYSFAVRVSDGRAAAEEQTVQVEVRPRRPFLVGLGYKQLLSFNRIVDPDSGDAFRNRAPYGGALLIGFKLSERWLLSGELSMSFMHVYPETESTEGETRYVQTFDPTVLVGARYRFPFDGFDLWAGGALGTSRLYLTAKRTEPFEASDSAVRAQYVVGDLSVGVDVPFGERLGLLLLGGVRGRTATEKLDTLRNTQLHVAKNGFLWGANLLGAAYVRL
jgi:hypothetical protein